mgnify:CR=1 FL=1
MFIPDRGRKADPSLGREGSRTDIAIEVPIGPLTSVNGPASLRAPKNARLVPGRECAGYAGKK